MPTIHEQKPKLEALKRELEAGGEMTDNAASIALTGAKIDEQGLSWIEVMPTAEKARNGNWYFTVTAEDLGTLAEFIQANPDRIPIDYDHASAEKGDTRAAGWFTGEAQVVVAEGQTPLGEVQDHDSVWAQVKWTPTAVSEIRDGAFRFISPEWGFANKDKKTGLLTKLMDIVAATLTNRPFFKNMAPVTAKLEPEQLDALTESYSADIAELVLAGLETEDERTTKAAEAIVAATSTTETGGNPSAADQGDPVADPTDPVEAELNDPKEIIVADEQPVTDYMKMLGLDETVDPKHRLAAAFRDKDEKILALEQERTDLTAKLAEADKLNDRVAELETRDRARDIEVILARAVDKGQALPAEKESLSEVFASDVPGLKRMLAARPAAMFNLEPKGIAGDPDRFADDAEVAQYVKTLRAVDPVDTEQAKTHLQALELLKEQGKTETYTNEEYVAAYDKASRTLVY